MIIEKLIAKQPKPVRDKSFIDVDRLVIPGRLRKEDVLRHEDYGKIDYNHLTEEDELAVALLSSLYKKEKKHLSINELLLQGGR